jgi:hypothetical protein
MDRSTRDANTVESEFFDDHIRDNADFSPSTTSGWGVIARRVLLPGGRIFAFVPNLHHPAMALLRHPRSPMYLSQGGSPNERPLRPGELRRAFGAAGITVLNQHRQSGISYRSVAPAAVRAFLTLYSWGDLLWQCVGLGRYFGTFVITAGEKPADGQHS